MDALRISHLTKRYPAFILQDISLTVSPGSIHGLIGKNGAGKSTTLKSVLHMIEPDQGNIEVFGKNFLEQEKICKQQMGIVLGGIDFYLHHKLSDITNVTKRFYRSWDENAYRNYLKIFEIDPQKRAHQLSAGMKVKYLIALALSHHAKLFLLDEPTSGLDPVSRDDLLDLFRHLVQDGERSILFSTHITSDLEKCADHITYLKEGRVLRSALKEEFIRSFQFLRTSSDAIPLSLEEIMIRTERKDRYDGLAL